MLAERKKFTRVGRGARHISKFKCVTYSSLHDHNYHGCRLVVDRRQSFLIVLAQETGDTL